MIQDRAILQRQTNSESYYDALNDATFNDLERCLTPISETAKHTAIVTIENE